MLREARRLPRRIRLSFLMGADQVAIGILRVVYRRELAERPRHGAALAGLDEKGSAARSGRCPQDSDRVGCGYPAFLPVGPVAFAAGGRRFDGGSGRVIVGAAGCRGNAAACGVEHAVRPDLRLDEQTLEPPNRSDDVVDRRRAQVTRGQTVMLPTRRRSPRASEPRLRSPGVAVDKSRR